MEIVLPLESGHTCEKKMCVCMCVYQNWFFFAEYKLYAVFKKVTHRLIMLIFLN